MPTPQLGSVPGALDSTARPALLDRLEAERFDCAVIGGGITGAGIAREAALRGLSVALLEAQDFAIGTSSRSSKLIHGGLRYLAMGDVALVRATALERKVIHAMAPHLAEPRWLVVPARSLAGVMKLRAGISTYEKLGAVAEADLHRNWSKDDLAREEPLLARGRYGHACVYREYLTDDVRLVLANLRAAKAAGAALASFAPVEGLVLEGEKAAGVMARCALTGRTLRVRARCVINAAGPWVDLVKQIEDPEAVPRLHLSKGVHVVLRAERLPVRHMFFLNTEDRRSIFVIRRGDCVYLGTTDTTYEGGSDTWPRITREDVDYLLAPVARDFAVEAPRAEEVVAAWAGLRPLIAEPGKKPAEISRRDEVWVGSRGVITVAGGKLTGFRLMARETLEKAAEVTGLRLAPAAREEPPLPGGDFSGEAEGLAARLGAETGLDAATAGRLARLYGSEAAAVVACGAKPLVPGAPLVAGEVDWAVRVEAATTLEDVLYRRTRCALFVPEAREAAVAPIAERMGALLGWDEARRGKEEREVRARLADELDFAGGRR